MPVQTIKTPGGETLVVLTLDEYEDLVDARDANAALLEIASGRMETFSSEQVLASLAAPTPLAFWRAHRGVAAQSLAEAAGISESALAALESGTADADPATYEKLAGHLHIDPEDLMPQSDHTAHGAEAAE
jgi:DNA-binding Xre family transcriptional regulator